MDEGARNGNEEIARESNDEPEEHQEMKSSESIGTRRTKINRYVCIICILGNHSSPASGPFPLT